MTWFTGSLALIGAVVAFITVLVMTFVYGRRFGIKYAYEHGEESFGATDLLKAEYVVSGRQFYQKPLVLRQMRELAELQKKYEDGVDMMHLDPEFYSIVLIGDDGYMGKTDEKTKFFQQGDTLNSVVMGEVQHYFFVCNRQGDRMRMLRNLMTNETKEKPKNK